MADVAVRHCYSDVSNSSTFANQKKGAFLKRARFDRLLRICEQIILHRNEE